MGAVPRGVSGWFFAAYALFILVQYPISRSWPASWAFYGLLLPASVLYAVQAHRRLAEILREPTVQAFLLLFAYVVFHALLFSPTYLGVSKTLLNTADTVIFFLCSLAFFAEADERFLRKLFIVLCVLVSACAVASIWLNHLHPNITTRLQPIGRTRNAMLGAYTYGLAGITAIYQYHASPAKRPRRFYLAVTLLVGLMILLTKSRMTMFTYALVAVLLHGVYCKSARPVAKFLLAGTAALALALIVSPALRHAGAQYLADLLIRKDARRMELWSLTLQNIAQQPLVGHGMRAMLSIVIDGKEHPISPHSIYLATAYYLGIPGLVLFLYPLYRCARDGMRMLFSGDRLAILAAGLLLMGLMGTATDFGPFVKTPGPLWLIFWLPIAFVLGMAIRRNARPAEQPFLQSQ